MKRLLAGILSLLLSGVPAAFAAAISSNNTGGGLWGTGSSWAGGVSPGPGDTAILVGSDTITIPAATSVTVGTSPATASGTYAITIGATAYLDVAGTLISRGDVSATGAHKAAQVEAGGHWNWDSSASSSPSTTYYSWVPQVQGQDTVLNFNGNSTDCAYPYTSGTTCAYMSSITTGGALPGDLNSGQVGGFYTGAFTGSYAALSLLGTSSRNAILTAASGTSFTTLGFDHSSCTTCGEVESYGSGGKVVITNMAFIGGINGQDAGEDLYVVNSNNNGTISGISSNLIKMVGNTGVWDLHSRISNYCDSFATNTFQAGSNLDQVIWLFHSSSDCTFPTGGQTASYMYAYYDNTISPGTSVHLIDPDPSGNSVNNFNVFEIPDIAAVGKAVLGNTGNPSVPTTATYNNTLVLPDKGGGGGLWIMGSDGANPNWTFNFYHATAFCQDQTSAPLNTCINFDEGANSQATVAHLEASILGSLAGNSVFKVSTANNSTPSQTLTVANYNGGLPGIGSTYGPCTGCTNQAHAYAYKFAATPGANDLEVTYGSTVNPGFPSTSRNLAFWDTLGLGNAPATAWSGVTAYTYTAPCTLKVSVAQGGVYGGLPINYYLTASNTNKKPDSASDWRNYWQIASECDLQSAIVQGTTYNGNLAMKAVSAWQGTGLVPTAGEYHFTYPGDANSVKNLGAFPMIRTTGLMIGGPH